VVLFREPPRTGVELSWRMLGIRFRILPSFFLIAGLLAYLFVGLNIIAIALDVGCIFFAILFTEVVQALVYRSYGLRSTVLIQEFGGGVYPESEPPTALQRITAALSNPAASFLLYAVVYYSNQEYRWSGAGPPWTGFVYQMLTLISQVWGVIGLLPVFPYPGGLVLLEILTVVSRRNGLVWTLGLSVVGGLAYVAYTAAVYFGYIRELPLVEHVTLPASLLLAVFLLMATLRNFQLLQSARAARRGYREPGYDDYDDDRRPWDR
jgi:hypothetical protein